MLFVSGHRSVGLLTLEILPGILEIIFPETWKKNYKTKRLALLDTTSTARYVAFVYIAECPRLDQVVIGEVHYTLSMSSLDELVQEVLRRNLR